MFGLRFVSFAVAALLCATTNVAAIPTPTIRAGEILMTRNIPPPRLAMSHHDRVAIEERKSLVTANLNAADMHFKAAAANDRLKNHHLNQIRRYRGTPGNVVATDLKYHIDKAKQCTKDGKQHSMVADKYRSAAQAVREPNPQAIIEAQTSAKHASDALGSLDQALHHNHVERQATQNDPSGSNIQLYLADQATRAAHGSSEQSFHPRVD